MTFIYANELQEEDNRTKGEHIEDVNDDFEPIEDDDVDEIKEVEENNFSNENDSVEDLKVEELKSDLLMVNNSISRTSNDESEKKNNGNDGYDKKDENNNILEKSINYQVHVQNKGWQQSKADGDAAGTTGEELRLEAIKIDISGLSDTIKIKYQTHIQNIGWQQWKTNGEVAGTEGKALRLEAVKIKLESSNDYSVVYRTHIQNIGWQDWKKDGEIAGTVGKSYRIEAIQIKIVEKEETVAITAENDLHIVYKTHVQNIGWQGYVADGQLSGTEGQACRMEAIKIDLIDGPQNAKIKYRSHVQNIGWQDWKNNDELSGTEGKALRIEAIQIKLENLDNYTVEYQVHIQNKGWSQWYIDGETAGTVGESKRLEAIRIRIVPKYKRKSLGIDVSRYNGNIDWNAVKKSGIDFAMIRVGFRGYGQEGNFALDPKFKDNIEGAKKAGLKVGIYFVTQAVNETEAIEEANWVLDKIKDYKLEMPVAIDVEYSGDANHNGRADHIDKVTRTTIIEVFCKNIQNAGYTPIVYLNIDWATNFVNMSKLTEYDTWIAHYRNNPDLAPSYSGNYTIWQYTSSGSINGVNGDVDCNICYKNY